MVEKRHDDLSERSRFVYGRCSVRISPGTPGILTGTSMVSPGTSKKMLLAMTTSFHILLISVSINHLIICCCMFWGTDTALHKPQPRPQDLCRLMVLSFSAMNTNKAWKALFDKDKAAVLFFCITTSCLYSNAIFSLREVYICHGVFINTMQLMIIACFYTFIRYATSVKGKCVNLE